MKTKVKKQPGTEAVANAAKESKTSTIKSSKLTKQEVDKANIKNTIKQEVISVRDVKYKYPEDVNDQLKRKKFRQEARNKINKMERYLSKLEKGSKLARRAERDLNSYKKEVLLVPGA